MKIFLDTSSLVKLYIIEQGTQDLINFLNKTSIEKIYLSEIAKIEIRSAIWTKVRTGHIAELDAPKIIAKFEKDRSKFHFIDLSKEVIERAKTLIEKHGIAGLRSMDSIQLSSALEVVNDLDKSFTADKKLQKIMQSEGLN